MLIGVDYHPSFQTIAFFVEETGEYDERRLNHSDGEAERFYRDLQPRGIRVRMGMEATGYSRWFERLLAELVFQLWMGHPGELSWMPREWQLCAHRVSRGRRLERSLELERVRFGGQRWHPPKTLSIKWLQPIEMDSVRQKEVFMPHQNKMQSSYTLPPVKNLSS